MCCPVILPITRKVLRQKRIKWRQKWRQKKNRWRQKPARNTKQLATENFCRIFCRRPPRPKWRPEFAPENEPEPPPEMPKIMRQKLGDRKKSRSRSIRSTKFQSQKIWRKFCRNFWPRFCRNSPLGAVGSCGLHFSNPRSLSWPQTPDGRNASLDRSIALVIEPLDLRVLLEPLGGCIRKGEFGPLPLGEVV